MERGDSMKPRSSGKLQIPKPTRHAYINFVQHFRQSYKGEARTSPQMVALAAAAWRGMGQRERAPYEAVAVEQRLKPRTQPTRRRKVARLQTQVQQLKEQLVQLKATAKLLQVQGRRRRGLRQRLQKRAAPKATNMRTKPTRRQVKTTHRVAQRPRHVRRQPSATSTSSCYSSS